MNSHNTSNLLHAFLDGELEQSHEQPLFNELASNGDLRNELRELLAMRSAVQQDIEAFTPPLAATSNVFSSLGFALPMASTGASSVIGGAMSSGAVNATALVAEASWWSKLWLPSVTALVGAGITFWLLHWGYSSNLTNMATAHAAEIQKIRSEAALKLTSQANSFRNQLQTASEPKIITKIEKVYYPKIEYRYSDRNASSNVPPSDVNSNTTVNSTIPTEKNSLIMSTREMLPMLGQYSTYEKSIYGKQSSMYFASPISQDNALIESHDAMTGEILEREFFPVDEPYYQHWSAKLGGVAATLASTPTPSLASPSATFNDLSLQLMYSLSEELSVGGIIGRESFPLSYNGMIAGSKIEREQYSSVFWGSITAQYQPHALSFFGGVQPYISLFGGGSEIGMIYRGQVGVQYPLSSRFSISAGYDVSGLFYSFQNQGFTTVKTGVNTGIIFHF